MQKPVIIVGTAASRLGVVAMTTFRGGTPLGYLGGSSPGGGSGA